MANVDAARGLWPIMHLTGGIIRQSEYTIASGYDTDIFKGDPVKLLGDGTIALADPTDRVLGVLEGVEWTSTTDPFSGKPIYSRYWPGLTVGENIRATVFDDPNQKFQIQADGAVTAADVGGLANHVAGTGNPMTGISAVQLSATVGTASALCRILGKVEAPSNGWGANVDLIVQIFQHELAFHGQATPGV